MLRLSTAALVWFPGGNATQTVRATNAGDGALTLNAAVPSGIDWLKVTIDPSTLPAYVSLQFTIDVSNLPRGTYTAEVAISDSNAIDSPQVVTATALVGGGDPLTINRFVAPGSDKIVPIYTGATGFCAPICPSVTATTQDGGAWLAVSFSSGGTITFSETAYIHLAPPAAMAPGSYFGTISVNNYAVRTIPVTMRVTTQPIAAPSVSEIDLQLAEGGPAAAYPFLLPISFTNAGMGTLAVQGVSAAGEGVSAQLYNGMVFVTAGPGTRGPGTYNDATVTVQCNAVNCPLELPVRLEVVPRGPPVVNYQGILDNAAFIPTVAPGDVAIVTGDQLSLSDPALASGFPLPLNLGGATVLVNGVYAPLYYASYGQIAFQMPYSIVPGTALVQVVRDGETGNTVSVNVVARAPQILKVTDAAYNLRDATHPTKPGETLIVWAIGLGATNPPVYAGDAAPLNPPAVALVAPQVHLANRVLTPAFAGLSGGWAGLYQVNVTVPADLQPGTAYLSLDNGFQIPLAVQ